MRLRAQSRYCYLDPIFFSRHRAVFAELGAERLLAVSEQSRRPHLYIFAELHKFRQDIHRVIVLFGLVHAGQQEYLYQLIFRSKCTPKRRFWPLAARFRRLMRSHSICIGLHLNFTIALTNGSPNNRLSI